MSLSFINANWHRKYPFKATASLQDADSLEGLPTDVIAGCRITSIGSHLDCYVSKVHINKGVFSIEVASGSTILGVAKGVVSKDHQAFSFDSREAWFSGTIVTGNKETLLNLERTFTFDSTTGALEPSVVTCYLRPAVSYLAHSGKKATGHVVLELNNLDANVTLGKIDFSVISVIDVSSRQDFTAELLTCKNPVIGSINDVEPAKNSNPAESNNIDIYGIAPVTVGVSAGTLEVGTTGIELEDVCKKVNIPPVNPSNEYYMNFEDATEPEFKQWPQYNL